MTGKKRSALGKGLNVLIPEASSNMQAPSRRNRRHSGNSSDLIKLSIEKIEPNREQPRKYFNEERLAELADSIKRYGVIEPLVVQKKEDYYEIIAGERRWRAARLAGLKEVPVVIKKYKENEVLEIALIENIQRENLNPIEEAKAYQVLIEEYHLTQEEVASQVSKSRSSITNALRLLKLSETVQEMLVHQEISMGHARAMLAIEDETSQEKVAKRVKEEGLSVREIEALVKEAKDKKEAKKKKVKENKDEYAFIYRELEEHLKGILGNKVTIKNKKNHMGKIEIEYYSEDDLERIVDLLQK